MLVKTQQKHVPWRWAFLAVCPWFSGMYVEMVSGAVLTLTLKKFMDDPALINGILSLNVLFNIVFGAVCLYISDRVWTRLGRRRPFLIGGWIPLTIAIALVPFCDNLYLLIPAVVIWMASQDISSTVEPLQQEIVPPHQRGRTAAMFNVIVQCVVIFTFVIVLGRFDEVQYFGDRVAVAGEHGAFWLAACFLLASMTLVGFFFRELPVRDSKVGESISPVRFFVSLFYDQTLWPVYLLVFAQSFMHTQVGAVLTLLFVEQWDYSPQQMGTNMFVGALMTIAVSFVVGALADRYDRVKLYIFGMSATLVATLVYYVFVQFMLPDRRPDLWQIIAFGQIISVFGMIAGTVAQPLMYDFIPRSAMGTAAAGISIVRSMTRWITLAGAGVWVSVYSRFFCEEGVYDYFSVYIYMMILTAVGLLIIVHFQRLVKKGILVAYGREGVEETNHEG